MRKFSMLAIILTVMAGMITIGLPTGAVAKDIKVGFVCNLTGPASTWGQFHAKGQKDYTRYVNDLKGGIAGQKIDLTVVDHAYKPPEGVKMVKKFCTSDKMDMIFTWDAATGNMVKPTIQKYKVPTFNYSVDQAILNEPIQYMYLPFGSYIMDSYAILEYIKTIHKGNSPPKVGLLTYMSAYGKTIHEPSKEYAGKHNMDIVGIIAFPKETVNLDTELLKLKKMGAEYVFVQILPAHIIMTLQAMDRVGLDVPVFGTWTATDPDFFKRGEGLIRDRMHMQFCGTLPGEGAKGMEVMEYLWTRYKTVDKFDCSYWEGVVMGMIMERAFERAYEQSVEINGETINKALETFNNEDFGDLVPNITYSSTDHSASWKARVVKINEDQTYTPVTAFWAPGKEKVKIIR